MASATWTCPVCQRRVPLRIEECWCGFKRRDAERQAAAERERQSPGAARELIGIAAVLLLGLGLYVQRQEHESERRQPQHAAGGTPAVLGPPPAAELLPSATPGAAPEPSPSPSPAEEQSPPAITALPAPRPSASASGDGHADSSSADGRRAAGLTALEGSYRQIVSEGQQLGDMLRRYEGDCTGLHTSLRIGNCSEIQGRLAGYGRDLVSRLEAAEEQARRSWVRPGDVRELRQRLGVDEAELSARRALTR